MLELFISCGLMTNSQHYLRILPVSFFCLFILFVSACNTEVNSELGRLEIRLHDAPLDSAEAVNVSINRVEINQGVGENGWTTINTINASYDLLSLTNGMYEVIGDTLLEPGSYNQIRLVLNETRHTIVFNDDIHDLVIPSQSLTEIKLDINTEIRASVDHVILLDFDVAKSVFQTGNEQTGFHYILVPVVRATALSESGLISGKIEPVSSVPIIYAIENSDTLASTFADTLNGEFQLTGIGAGTYRVAIEPRNSAYISRDINGVQVMIGENTHLGTIELAESGF